MFGFDPSLITFTIYIFGMLLIGVLAYYYTNNLSDYILGGRRLGSFVTAMSAGASDMSGWLLMGLPGAVYLSGLVEGWIAIGLTIGAYFNWLLVAGRLRVYTELNNNALTLPEYFHNRFGSSHKLLKLVSATIILVFLLFIVLLVSWLAQNYSKIYFLWNIPPHFGTAQRQPLLTRSSEVSSR